MTRPEQGSETAFASDQNLITLHQKLRSWACKAGDETIADDRSVLVATTEVPEAVAEDFGIQGSVVITYVQPYVERLQAAPTTGALNSDQTSIAYNFVPECSADEVLPQSIAAGETVIIGRTYFGMYGVRKQILREPYQCLYDGSLARDPLDHVTGAVVEGVEIMVPERELCLDDSMSMEPEHGASERRGLRAVLQRMIPHRLIDVIEHNPLEDPRNDLPELYSGDEAARLQNLEFDRVRLTVQEAAVVESLVRAICGKPGILRSWLG